MKSKAALEEKGCRASCLASRRHIAIGKLNGKGLPVLGQVLRRAALMLGDVLTDRTGWAAIRVPLHRASGPREVTLAVPGYVQTNSYCCGAVCAAMVVRYFRPAMSFGVIYDAINPDPELGASAARLRRGLRACGIRTDSRRGLTFAQMCAAIDVGWPVIVSICNPGAEARHWVVAYGYGRQPDALFIAGNCLPGISANRVSRATFEALWDPKGNGLICCKARQAPKTHHTGTSGHK